MLQSDGHSHQEARMRERSKVREGGERGDKKVYSIHLW